MEISVVVNQVIILFLIILVGIYARKQNIITVDMTSKLSNLLLQVIQPMLLLSSFDFELSREILRNAVLVFVMSFLIHLFSMLIGKFLYFRHPKRTRNVLKFITAFSNCGFMGFPVLYSIFGSKGVFYCALYLIPFNILAFSFGVMLFTGKSDKDTLKKIITHPINVSVVLGMILFVLQIQLPLPISEAVAMIGSMASPLSMLIVGSLLAEVPLRGMLKGREVYIGSMIRLIVMPLIVYGLLRLLPLPKEVFQVCVILVAMPAAANTAILAEKFGGDAMLSSRLIGITTVFSIFTIPLIFILL
jgi:predicted permease